MNIATAFKLEISRVAKKEMRAEAQPLKKSSSQYRTDIAALKRRVTELERLFSRLFKSGGRAKPAPDVVEVNTKLRFRASGFASLRRKLGLSAGETALLLRVSDQSVYKW